MMKTILFCAAFFALALFISCVLTTPALAGIPGDANNDGKVDLTDLNLVRNHFGSNTSQGDTNGDGVVDLVDLNAVRNYFGTIRESDDQIPPVTTLTPSAEEFFGVVQVVFSTNEPAAIYYTTDGSTPTTCSRVYAAPIRLTQDATFKFFSVDKAGNAESIRTQRYRRSPPKGDANQDGLVNLTDLNEVRNYFGGAGPQGDTNGDGRVDLTDMNDVRNTFGTDYRPLPSETEVPAVQANPLGKPFQDSIEVILFANEPAAIYYTTDGSTPNSCSRVYLSPIRLTQTRIIKFLAIDAFGNASAVKTEEYTKSSGPTLVPRGVISRNTRWTRSGSPYMVNEGIHVAAPTGTAVLTIEPGVEVQFGFNSFLIIGNGTERGALVARGTSASPILFTRPPRTFGNWGGIRFMDATNDNASVMEHCIVEYGGILGSYYGFELANILVDSSRPTLRNLTLRNSGRHGLALKNSSVTVEGLTLEANGFGAVDGGIVVIGGSPLIQGNTIQGNQEGIVLVDSSARIENNVIQNNIRAAISIDLVSARATFIGNRYLNNGRNLIQLRGEIPFGTAPAPFRSTTLKKQEVPYGLSGYVWVISDIPTTTLTIEPGVEIRCEPGSSLRIGDGQNQVALVAQGTPAEPILFTAADPEQSWGSIAFSDHTIDANTILEHCVVEYGGIQVFASRPVFRNTTIRKCPGTALFIQDTDGTFSDLVIEDSSIGIQMIRSSPTITQSRILSNYQGFYIIQDSAPTITQCVVSGNYYGFNLDGIYGNPLPIVHRCSIDGSSQYNVYTVQFNPGGSSVHLDFKENWWGTRNVNTIAQKIYDLSDFPTSLSLPVVDFTPIRDAAIFQVRDFDVSNAFFSPNGDGLADTINISGNLGVAANWTLTFLNSAQEPARVITGNGIGFHVSWDGKGDNGIVPPDGPYTLRLEATEPISGETLSPEILSVWIDTIFPVAAITSPEEGEILFGSVKPISGTASDAHLLDFTLRYGQGSSPTSFPVIFTTTTAVTDGFLGNWDLGTLSINGSYVLRLTVRDKARNSTTVEKRVQLDNIHLTRISRTPIEFRPLQGETISIRYALDHAANVILRLFDETTNGLVKTFLDGRRQLPGAYEHTWDGRDDGGVLAPLKNAYYFTMHLQDGPDRIAGYTPPYIPPIFSASVSRNFNPYSNERLPISLLLQTPARPNIRIQVGDQLDLPITGMEPFKEGNYTFYWDGRDHSGNLLPIYSSYSIANFPGFPGYPVYYVPDPLHENVIMTKVEDTSIRLSTLRADAYVIIPVFGEMSKITYSLPQELKLTLNVKDPNGNHFRMLVENQIQSTGSHEIFWDGTNDDGDYIDIPGHYTLEFQMEDPAQPRLGTRRGNVSVIR